MSVYPPWLKAIPASAWLALGVVGAAALLLWWDKPEDPFTKPPGKLLRAQIPARPVAHPLVAEDETDAVEPEETLLADPSLFPDPLPPGAVARLGTLHLYHERGVSCCGFLPGSRTLATGGHDGTVRFWDTNTGKEERLFRISPSGGISALAFAPDGALLAVSSRGDSVQLWEVASGKRRWQWKIPGSGALHSVFAPDGKTLLTAGGDGVIRQWETATGKELPCFVGHLGPVNSLAYTPDGQQVVSNGDDETVRVWEVAAAEQRGVIPTKDCYQAIIAPEGRRMAQNTIDTIRIRDIMSGRILQELLTRTATSTMTFSPNGQLLATTRPHDPRLSIWDVATGKKLWELLTIRGRTAYGTSCFSSDGELLATAQGSTIRIWDARTGKERLNLPRLQAITALCFSDAGQRLITGNADQTIRHWDVATGRQVGCARINGRVLNFSPHGNVAAMIQENWNGPGRVLSRTISLCDAATGKQLHALDHRQPVHAAIFSSDGIRMAVLGRSNPATVVLWETATGKEIRLPGKEALGMLASFGAVALPLAFSPDGKTVAWGCTDCTVHLLDANTGEQCGQLGNPYVRDPRNLERSLNGVHYLVYSADGKTLAASVVRMNRRGISLWDVPSQKELCQLTLDEPKALWINAMTFSPDGKTLAVAAEGVPAIHLWDVATGQVRPSLHGHLADVLVLAFSPDGKHLASGSKDGTALIWDVAPSTP